MTSHVSIRVKICLQFRSFLLVSNNWFLPSKQTPTGTIWISFFPHLRLIINVGHFNWTMIIKNEEDDIIGWIKKFANVNCSSTIDQQTIFDALNVILEGCVEIFLASDWDESVQHMVTLEQILEDFCGTNPINITVYQH